MIRLTRMHRLRISNRLAALGAFLLIAATLAAGIDHTMDSPAKAGASVAASAESAMDRGQAGKATTARSNKGFKVRLYLFRRN